REHANQLTPNHRRGRQQKFSPPLIRLAQNGIAVIESIEKLRQLEGMLGQISRLGGRDALDNNVRSFRSRKPELPDVIARFAIKVPGNLNGRDEACLVSARAGIARE